MNHYPRHIGDFAAATQGLTLTERGAYDALLDQYYAHERPLPLDRREVYRMAVCGSTVERKAVDYVLQRYFSEQPDGWHNKRADEEIARFQEKSGKARQSAGVRWSNSERNASASRSPTPNAMRTHTEGNANQNQNQNQNQITTSAPNAIAFDAAAGWTGIDEADLGMWRSAYPALDLPAQLQAAAAWARANPKNGKSNWRRFLTNWLSRAQDRARPMGGGQAQRGRVVA